MHLGSTRIVDTFAEAFRMRYCRLLVTAADALSALPGVRKATVTDGRATLIVSVLHEAIPALLALVGTDRAFSLLTTHSATLEDVFVSLTGRQLRDG